MRRGIGSMSVSTSRRRWQAAGWTDAVAAVLVLALAVVNAVLLPRSLVVVIERGPAVDWLQFVEGGRRVFDGDLYETTATYGFRYSPIVAYVFAAIGGIGAVAWRLAHVAAALALPTWPMRLLTLAAWPFWYDVETGNVMVLVVLAAAWALRGNPVGIGAFLLLTLWFPRPLMLPILVYLLWKQPTWRVPALVLAAVMAVPTIASGWALDWVRLLTTLGAEAGSPNNLGPTRFLGPWWLVIGIPLAAWLTRHGRLGWASLAISFPYVLPYYLLMLVLELPERIRAVRSARARQGGLA